MRSTSSPVRRLRRGDFQGNPMECGFFHYLSPLHALQTGWHRSCSVTAHKKQLLRTTRRKAAAEGLKALEALPPQTLPVLLLVGADGVVEEMLLRHGQAIVIGQGRTMRLHAEGQPLVYWQGAYGELVHT